jgi:hypothetical protein
MPYVDILDLHEKIKTYFENEKARLPQYKEKAQHLIQTIPNVCESTRRTLQGELKELEEHILSIETDAGLCFYMNDAEPIIYSYTQMIQKPIQVSFMGKKANENTEEKKTLMMQFLYVVKKYIDITKLNPIIEKSPFVKKAQVCDHCGSKQVDIFEKVYSVCMECGFQKEISKNAMSYKDVKRVNVGNKYTYERKIHFKDCINQYQGKQNVNISPDVLQTIQKCLEEHNLVDPGELKEVKYKRVTRNHIYIFLKECGFSKHYEDTFLIYHLITGKKLNDISHIENQILNDFDTLSTLYDKKFKQSKKIARKSFINSDYVLYQLLRKYKHPCRKEDFAMLKTLDRKSFHDDICKELFEELGWNFTPIF